jgi:alpha-tubulin suppressor-like RCC1 family protein
VLCGELTQISAGDYHALALCRNGSVLAFGSNGRCQLGDGSKIHSSSAQMVADLDEGFVKVAAGGLHSLALHSEGFVLAWGDNSSGQVGQSICPFENDAEIRHRGWPVQVATPVIPRFLDQNVVDIAAGFLHSLALLADGRILAWGQNIFGQLGTGKNLTWPPYDADEDDDLESRSDAFKRTHSQKSA